MDRNLYYVENLGHHILQNTTIQFKSPKIIHKKCMNCRKEYEIHDEEFQEAYLDLMGVSKDFRNVCSNCLEEEIAKNRRSK